MKGGFTLRAQPTERRVTAAFPGLDARERIPEGALHDARNLTTAKYPLLATRPRRGLVATLTAPGGLTAKDALAWVDGGTLYLNGLATALTGLAEGEKQLVSMGAFLCVFPDKVYYNTADPSDYGSMEADYASLGDVSYSLCRADGRPYTNVWRGDAEPADSSAELWLSTAGGELAALVWSAAAGAWTALDTVYTKLTFASQGAVPALFSAGDGVTVSGSAFAEANGEKIICALGGAEGSENDWIVLVGLLESAFTQTEGSVRLERKLPPLDFVCEAGNRLWGCFYGFDGERTLNEICASALGDFKNWRQYRGLSTDSWAASVGSDGPWTGAVSYLGSPCFFKADRVHRVGVSAIGAHTLQETVCRGVQRGSHKSLAVLNETLFYKSADGVCAWQGGFPLGVGEALGETRYFDAVGGAAAGRYVLSMRDASGDWALFVYDLSRALWMREDDLHALQFAALDGELCALDAETGKILALFGTAGEPEGDFAWSAESGLIGLGTPERKYLSRLELRLRLGEGASAAAYLQFDSDGVWHEAGAVARGTLGTALLPLRPRRCDHLRLKLCGTGEMELLSVAHVYETGSDVV